MIKDIDHLVLNIEIQTLKGHLDFLRNFINMAESDLINMEIAVAMFRKQIADGEKTLLNMHTRNIAYQQDI